MLQTFRDNLKGTVAFLIVGVIVFIFALTGIDALFVANNKSGIAAEINDIEVTENELRRNIYIRKQRLIDLYENRLPSEFLSDENLRGPVLEELIMRKAVSSHARDQGMRVADSKLDQLIVSTPAFQQDGRFSAQLYTQLIQNMGYRPSDYKQEMATDLIMNQLTGGIARSAFITDEELTDIIAVTHQTRDYSYLTLPLSAELKNIDVEEDDLAAYYEDNKADYMSPEKVKVSYIDVDVDALVDTSVVTEADLKAQYQQEIDNFKAVTERHVAHILVEKQDDGSHEQRLAEIQAKLAAGEDFSNLAKTYSDDLGSREQGGDLGITTGDTFPEAFEKAAAKLAQGEVSAPVETDAGIHLIKLVGLNEKTPPPFEEERPRLVQAIARAEAENRFVEILQSLGDLTFNAEDLQMAGDELGLQVKESDYITRNGGPGVLRDNQVLAAIFSDEVLKNGHNSEVLELSESHVAVVRVTDHQPVRQQTLEEVHDRVTADFKAMKAGEALTEKAQTLTAKIEAGDTIEQLAKDQKLEWKQQKQVKRTDSSADRNILDFAFKMSIPADGSVVESHTLPSGDIVIVDLTSVTPGELTDETERKSFAQRLAQQLGQQDYATYQAQIKDTADITVY